MQMKILLTDAGKRYNREWIFRHFSHSFETGQSYAIVGANGSGKSTLLQVLSGALLLNEGNISLYDQDSVLNQDIHYRLISFSAPYLELIEEMTALEFLEFHQKFKPFVKGFTSIKILEILQLQKAQNKQMRYFSSGMKQRIKLAQCILSDNPFTLLDEPCTNLDQTGIDLYHQLITEYGKEKCLIVSSNDKVEYSFCNHKIDITDYKTI